MGRKRITVKAGDVYGRLTIIREVGPRRLNSGQYHRRVECRCECGVVKEYLLPRLRNGGTKSCGCLARELVSQRATTHGATGGVEYTTWLGLRARCNNPKSTNYGSYGGRGIKVCDRWNESFEAFFEDMGARPSADHSIDRIDNDGDYELGNCRWATQRQQSRNTRKNVFVTHAGETKCVAEWAEQYGISGSLLHCRLRAGWDFEEAVSIEPWKGHGFNLQTPISKRTLEWYRDYARLVGEGRESNGRGRMADT